MAKVINFELSKRLNKLGLLDNIDTEYYINYNNSKFTKEDINEKLMIRRIEIFSSIKGSYINEDVYKTLTLEEAIEFIGKNMCYIGTIYPNGGVCNFTLLLDIHKEIKGTLIECFEQFIEYLLDNNLIGKQDKKG